MVLIKSEILISMRTVWPVTSDNEKRPKSDSTVQLLVQCLLEKSATSDTWKIFRPVVLALKTEIFSRLHN